MRCALSIAGSDSVGGAGIQADIKAMSSLDVHCCAVITALTAQNTTAVEEIMPVPADMIQAQLEAVLKDVDIKAVKTGMLYSAETVGVVADILEDHEMPLILDPVMVAGVGDSLARDDLAKAIRRKLIPMCELITPNKHEAEVLSGISIRDEEDVKYACEVIGKDASSVLLKGGHMNGTSVIDYLYLSSEFTRIEYPRLERAGHGGGCTLSSFITANMAKSVDIVNSILISRKMIQQSIADMYVIGHGDKLVNPIIRQMGDKERFRILDDLDDAADVLINITPEEVVPNKGVNIAFATRNAAGPEDVAAIEGKLSFHNGSMRKNGKSKFGTAGHLSYAILAAMEKNPKIRSAFNMKYSKDMVDVMEEVGLSIEYTDRKKHKNALSGELIRYAIQDAGYVPDVIVEKASNKGDNIIRIFGKNPESILEKLELIF